MRFFVLFVILLTVPFALHIAAPVSIVRQVAPTEVLPPTLPPGCAPPWPPPCTPPGTVTPGPAIPPTLPPGPPPRYQQRRVYLPEVFN